MGATDALLHAINFASPAAFLALLVAYLGRYLQKNRPLARTYIGSFAINFIVCLVVLLIGLILTGRDGKMITYLGMVIASASTQWFLSGSWRKP